MHIVGHTNRALLRGDEIQSEGQPHSGLSCTSLCPLRTSRRASVSVMFLTRRLHVHGIARANRLDAAPLRCARCGALVIRIARSDPTSLSAPTVASVVRCRFETPGWSRLRREFDLLAIFPSRFSEFKLSNLPWFSAHPARHASVQRRLTLKSEASRELPLER